MKIVRSALYGALGEADLSAALLKIKVNCDLSVFLQMQTTWPALRHRFDLWVQDPTGTQPENPSQAWGPCFAYLDVIDVLQAIFRFEADQALSNDWYGEQSHPRFERNAPTTLTIGDQLPASHVAHAIELSQRLKNVYSRPAELTKVN